MLFRSYSGKPEELDDWRFKLEVFLGTEDGFLEFTKWAEEQVVDVDDDDIATWQEAHENVDASWINRQMYNVLALNLKEPVLSLVKNLSAATDTNGANAWRKISNYFAGSSVQRIQGLAQRVYSPQRCKAMRDVPAAVEMWERHVKEFEKAEKVQHGEQTRIHGLRQLVPEELSRNIQAMSHTMRTYAQVKSYVLEQVASRRDAYFPKNPSAHDDSGPTPMDVGYVASKQDEWVHGHATGHAQATENPAATSGGEESIYLLGGKGVKGKGKGYGKNQPFQGTCNHCGEWGHRLRDCPVKDAEMKGVREAKAKGKGKSQSEWPGKGWSNPYTNSWWTPQPKGKGFGPGGKGFGKWEIGRAHV